MGASRMQFLSHTIQNRSCSFGHGLNSAGLCRAPGYGDRREHKTKNLVLCAHAGVDKGREWVLALDVGTGGTKAALLFSNGLITASAFSPHPVPVPSSLGGPGSQEQDQECWWSATIIAVNKCMSSSEAKSHNVTTSHLGAIAVTGQMQDVIILPKNGLSSKHRAMLYSDTRAVTEAKEIARMAGSADLLATVTGSHQGASSLLAKFRWLDKHYPMEHGELLFGGHDYVTWKLCGAAVTDTTTASTTGLTNTSFQYADDLLNTLELGHWLKHLPRIFAADVPCGQVSESGAHDIGLRGLQGIPVIHCCGDAGACTLGAGAGSPGSLYAYLGTSGWVAGSFPRSQEAAGVSVESAIAGVYNLGHPDPALLFKSGSIMTAGGNVKWAASNLVSDLAVIHGSPLQHFDHLAISACAGSGGLLFLPYLNGERCPFDDWNARASFIGISASTTKAEMFHAVLEGICFAMRSGRDAVLGEHHRESELPPLRLVGGGARSPLWPKILSDVFGQTVEILTDSQEVGVKGAALLAGKWLGWHTSLSPGGRWIQVERVVHPSPTDSELYNTLYATYGRAYGDLRHIFKELSYFRKDPLYWEFPPGRACRHGAEFRTSMLYVRTLGQLCSHFMQCLPAGTLQLYM